LVLQRSGELAVPQMIDDLRDARQSQLHDVIRSALLELGRSSLNPLCTATEMPAQGNDEVMITIVSTLGDIGFDTAAPYLVRLTSDRNTPGAVRQAAANALRRVRGYRQNASAADLFYEQAEKFYYHTNAIRPDPRHDDVAYS